MASANPPTPPTVEPGEVKPCSECGGVFIATMVCPACMGGLAALLRPASGPTEAPEERETLARELDGLVDAGDGYPLEREDVGILLRVAAALREPAVPVSKLRELIASAYDTGGAVKRYLEVSELEALIAEASDGQ